MQAPTGAGRWLPGLQTLRSYRRAWLPRDLVAGIVLTALLVPAGMGYAEASGLPAIYGLYATIVPLVVYALVGPSRILVLGPDSSLAPLIAAAILPLAAGSESEAVALAGMLAIFSGLLCMLAGFARFGFIADLLSKPVRYGYMNGIALTVLLSQLPKLFGFSVDADGVIPEAQAFVRGVADGETNRAALVIGVACLAVILGFKRWRPRIPGVLVAVVGATAAVGVFGLAERYGLSVVGTLPKGLPTFQLPSVPAGDLGTLVAGAIGIALVSFADTSVLSRTFAIRGGYRVDPNQELVADPGRRGGRRQDAADRPGRRPGDRADAGVVPEPGAEPARFGAGGRSDHRGDRADRGQGGPQAVPGPQDRVRPLDRVLPGGGRPRGHRGHLHRHRPGAPGLHQAGVASV
jgi:MFS superfamily sulfate permease-like transporter